MVLPIQKLTTAEKLYRQSPTSKNNYEETIDFYIESANWNQQTEEIAALYRAIEGELDEREYELVKNPFNKQKRDSSPATYNATLKNFNILKGIANLLMGEFGRRAHEYVVASFSPTDEITKKEGLNIVIRNYYAQHVANELHNLGLQLGQQVQELEPLDKVVADYNATFDETRAISGQEVLDYIVHFCDLPNKYIDLYWDWVIAGRAFTFKEVNHDDVYFEIVPSHELFVPNEAPRFIEDRSFVVRRQYLPPFSIIDKFRGRIPEKLIDQMELKVTQGLSTSFSTFTATGRNGYMVLPTLYVNSASGSNPFTNGTMSSNGIELFHVQYKSYRAYQVLTYIDPLSGIERQMEVGEDYKLNKAMGDISLDLQWENQIIQGYKCLDFYLEVGPLETDRADLNQEGLQKLSYNGICERSSTGSVQSIIKDGLPYQRDINVTHYQIDKLVNKNKDKLLIMPYSLIPKKQGMSTADQMYHADSTSILWVDDTSPSAAIAGQMIKSVDMSLGNFIREAIERIRFIKGEYWESIGMNAQRYSDVNQNAGKAVTEQAIVRSAIITYELTRQFDSLVEKDYQGLLDISKQAYIKGKKRSYVRSDGSLAFLNMNEDDAVKHSEASYNVFVKDASIMSEGVQAIRQQILSFIQNGVNPAIAGEVWKTNNISKLTVILKKLQKEKEALDKQIADDKARNDQALQQLVNDNAKEERDLKYYEIDKEFEGVKYAADSRANNNTNEPKPVNELEAQLANHKMNKENIELSQREKEIEIKRKVANNKPNNK